MELKSIAVQKAEKLIQSHQATSSDHTVQEGLPSLQELVRDKGVSLD